MATTDKTVIVGVGKETYEIPWRETIVEQWRGYEPEDLLQVPKFQAALKRRKINPNDVVSISVDGGVDDQ